MIFHALFRKAPTPEIADDQFISMGPPAAGIDVNEWNAIQLSAVYACIRLLSETLAQLPLNVIETTTDGNRPVPDHPVAVLLRDSPNPWMTSFNFRQMLQSHVSGWGNGYAFIERAGSGYPLGIYPLLPDRTDPELDNGTLIYKTVINNTEETLRPDMVLHVSSMGYDGLRGWSPLSMFKEAISVGLATQRFGARFFGSGANLSGVLQHPGRLKRKAEKPDDPSPIDRLREQFAALYGGIHNSHSVAVLEEGMQYARIGIPPEDSQFLETRKFTISDVARIYNVPSHMINDLERATFNNISELSIGFLRYTMTPWLVRWEQELNRKLFPEREQGRYRVKFNVGGLLRGTQKERAEYYKMAVEGGWMSRNEVRRLEDLNPVDGLDNYLIPLNMGDGQQPPNSDNSQSDPASQSDKTETDSERMLRLFNPLIQKFAARLVDADRRALVRAGRVDDGEQDRRAREWVGTDSREYIRREFMPLADSLANVSDIDAMELTRAVSDWFTESRGDDLDRQSLCSVLTMEPDSVNSEIRRLIREATL